MRDIYEGRRTLRLLGLVRGVADIVDFCWVETKWSPRSANRSCRRHRCASIYALHGQDEHPGIVNSQTANILNLRRLSASTLRWLSFSSKVLSVCGYGTTRCVRIRSVSGSSLPYCPVQWKTSSRLNPSESRSCAFYSCPLFLSSIASFNSLTCFNF